MSDQDLTGKVMITNEEYIKLLRTQELFDLVNKVELRPVKVYKMIQMHGMRGAEKVLQGRGLFHGWGSDFQDCGEHGPGNFSIGIVELSDGVVAGFHISMIQFTDKG